MGLYDRFVSDEVSAQITRMVQDDIFVYWMGGLAPVQAQGWIDGHAFYFRARGDAWEMHVTKEETRDIDAAVYNPTGNNWSVRESYGTFPDASYMPALEMLQLVEKMAQKWRSINPV